MKKYIITSILIVFCIFPSNAVLKERNLPQTLSVLRSELENSYNEQTQMLMRLGRMNEMQHKKLISVMQKSEETALMLYSQKQDYTFDLTYACHEAIEQYHQFNKSRMPFDKIMGRIDMNISQYNGLITTLQQLPPPLVALPRIKIKKGMMPHHPQKNMPFMLDLQGQADRAACLRYVTALRAQMITMRNSIVLDDESYSRVAIKLKEVNDYAMKCYRNIQHSIFVNGDDSYFTILGKFSRSMSQAKRDVSDKYNDSNHHIHSEWRGPIVFGLITFVVFYFVLATFISNVVVRVLMRKVKAFQTTEFKKKKICLIIAAAALIFAISIMVARTFMSHNFFIMASGLLVEYAWLLSAIFISLLIRMNGDQIKSGFRIYTPIILMGFIIIVFRIIFIPNNLVELIFPPILLIFTLWQWYAITRHNNNIARNDIFYTWISLTVMVVSCFFAWFGYVLLSVQVFIWWLFQLIAIQTITCFYDLLKLYESEILSKRVNKYHAKNSLRVNSATNSKIKKGEYIKVTWFFDLVNMALLPVAGVLSVLFCIWWAADVFDLTDTCFVIFMHPFIDLKDVCQLSLFKIVLVAGMYFIFRYLNYTIKSFYHYYKLSSLKRKNSGVVIANQANFTLSNNLTAILVWGTYFIFTIILLQVPKSGISIVTAGLATGVGFAMKDLLENFFYGVSLMTGRVRVGDYIECDGIRGKVDSITYQSTQIATMDGSVIAFLNSSLFNKNFKNLTRNHLYELDKITVGVAYGVNVEEVRKMLLDAINALQSKDANGRDIMSKTRGVNVMFDSFGDNSVNLSITLWVLVVEKVSFISKVQEAVYNTLNKNNIEIPYPHRDVYIHNPPKN